MMYKEIWKLILRDKLSYSIRYIENIIRYFSYILTINFDWTIECGIEMLLASYDLKQITIHFFIHNFIRKWRLYSCVLSPDVSFFPYYIICSCVANYDGSIGYDHGIIFIPFQKKKNEKLFILQISCYRYKMKGGQKLDHPLHHQLHSWHYKEYCLILVRNSIL